MESSVLPEGGAAAATLKCLDLTCLGVGGCLSLVEKESRARWFSQNVGRWRGIEGDFLLTQVDEMLDRERHVVTCELRTAGMQQELNASHGMTHRSSEECGIVPQSSSAQMRGIPTSVHGATAT